MKKLLLLLLPLVCAAADYEFLTPQTVVIRSSVKLFLLQKNITRHGVWKKENALCRNKQGDILRKPDITVFNYLTFTKPLKDGEYVNAGKHTLQYKSGVPSSIFKLNQLGNGAKQMKKYAYMGAWLGNAGAMPLKHLAGKSFEIRRASDGKCVFRNVLRLRRDDPFYRNEIPFTGEEVLELDYSQFNTPGSYYFHVDGIGRSMEFKIGPETLNEAFYIHARGLYHKRCGIAKTQPFTAWESPACHNTVIRGRFPGNEEHCRIVEGDNDSGFFDIKDRRIGVRHFDLIKDNPPYIREEVKVSGGWHDAADYDRRPQHLRIVSKLSLLYLMKPENFIDGQLNIPESGNGIPDLLDEAAWGLNHLLTAQRADGGVGTWFETDSHPGINEGLPDKDPRTYYISAPSCNGTLEYAASAAVLALALKRAGADASAEKYINSAIKAWNFARNPENRLVSWLRLKNKMISYREESCLYGEHLLNAGAALYAYTSDKKYLEPLIAESGRIKETMIKDFWKWSKFSGMMLELFPVKELDELRLEYRKIILRDADKMLSNQENAYPYRTLWHAHNAGWVHAMAWGNYHPLRCALTLISAHKLTGEGKYLQGAYLANDFHNGANPLGRSMTSGLGKVYPAVFLDLVSYADGIGEFVPGITPYGNTFGLDRKAVDMVYKENADKLPVFRRYVNLEFLSVPSSEYSVWETISPAAVATGYLLEKPALPSTELKNRKPAGDFRKLPGYRALP